MAKLTILAILVVLFAKTAFAKVTGLKPTTANPKRVLGGYECSIRDHPYMVALLTRNDFKLVCGGTILSKNYVLTSYYCVKDKNCTSDLVVLAGAETLKPNSTLKNPYAKMSHVKKCYFDKSENMTHFVALLELAQPIYESLLIKYVTLATPKDIENTTIRELCKNGTEMGWGHQSKPANDNTTIYNEYLQCNTPVVMETCHYWELPKNGICSYPFDDGACYDDLGGPLMCQGMQIGLLELGAGCEESRRNSVYTRVFEQADFLNSYIKHSGRSIGVSLEIFTIRLSTMFLVGYIVK